MEKHKFSVLEIQEYYETYCMRKDLAEQVIRVLGDWGGFCQWNFNSLFRDCLVIKWFMTTEFCHIRSMLKFLLKN